MSSLKRLNKDIVECSNSLETKRESWRCAVDIVKEKNSSSSLWLMIIATTFSGVLSERALDEKSKAGYLVRVYIGIAVSRIVRRFALLPTKLFRSSQTK